MKDERYIGVDGCKAGWFAVCLFPDKTFEFDIHPTIRTLWNAHRSARAILIDIPIGLISGNVIGRGCDAAARTVLKPLRHNSVFSPPCREALAARTYEEACRINHEVCSRKISRQAWGICPKIKEVDDFLHNTPEAMGIIRETHPEICFWAMAGYRPMRHRKKATRVLPSAWNYFKRPILGHPPYTNPLWIDTRKRSLHRMT